VESLPSVNAGEWLAAVGYWVRDRGTRAAVQGDHDEDCTARHRRGR